MTFTLTKKTLRLWQFRLAAVTVVLSALFSALARVGWYFAVFAAVIAAIGAVEIFVYLPLYRKVWKMAVSTAAVEVECGVIIRVNHIMPNPRMIYTNSYETPLGKKLGLRGIVLKAARGRLVLPELEYALTDEVLKYITKG